MTVLPLPKKPRRVPSRTPLLPKNHDEAAGGGGATFAGAVFNLSTTIVGAGIMALPASVKVLGLLPGLAMILAAGVLTRASINMILRLGRSATSKGATAATYAGIAGDAFGCTGRSLLQSCIIVNNLGMLVVYMIIIDCNGRCPSRSSHFSPCCSRHVLPRAAASVGISAG